MIENFFIFGELPAHVEKGTYEPLLIFASYVIAAFSSYVGLTLATYLFSARTRNERLLLHWGGAFAFGSGIWTMHFVGMLSFKMNMFVTYDPFLTLLSLVTAIAVAYGVLLVTQAKQIGTWHFVLAPLLLGFGICAMHYTGMAAMGMDANVYYVPWLFFLSVSIAVIASAAALWLVLYLDRQNSRREPGLRVAGALIMGLGICGMHYTGMAAAVFIPFASCRYDTGQSFDMLALTVTATTSIILGIGLALGVFTRNVTRRVRAEAEAANTRRWQDAILDNAPYAIITTDTLGIIQIYNRAAERMSGYSAAEMIGKKSPLLLHDKGEIVGRAEELRQELGRPVSGFEVLTAKPALQKTEEHEWTFIRKDGYRFPVYLAITAIRDAREEVYGYMGLAQDISERKAIEKMKNEFVSTVSHELRTPLTSIRGSLGLLANGKAGEISETASRFVGIALKNSERLVHIINDILDMDKIESGKMELQIRPVKVAAFLAAAVESNQSYGERCHVRFLFDPIPQDMIVLADSDRLMQVMSNLLSNAAKFSPAGGDVRISVQRLPSHIRFYVKDTGTGIPAAFRGRIFEKFAQADNSDTRTHEGTGLGLSISRKLVNAMHGIIDFETESGKGTTFYFDLPAA